MKNDPSYHVVFRYTAAAGRREGLLTTLRYNNEAHFIDEWVKRGRKDEKEVVEKGVTEAHAIQVCRDSLKEFLGRTAATAKESSRTTSRAQRLMARLSSDPKIRKILSQPHPGSR